MPYVYFGSLFFQPLKVQTQGMSDNEKSELLIYNSCLRDMSVIYTSVLKCLSVIVHNCIVV